MSFISNPSWLFLFMEPGQFMTLVEVSLGSGVIKGGSDFTVWIIYLELVPPFWLPPSLTRPSSWSDITVVSRLKKIYFPKLLGLADSSTALEDRLRTVDKRMQVALTILDCCTWDVVQFDAKIQLMCFAGSTGVNNWYQIFLKSDTATDKL